MKRMVVCQYLYVKYFDINGCTVIGGEEIASRIRQIFAKINIKGTRQLNMSNIQMNEYKVSCNITDGKWKSIDDVS